MSRAILISIQPKWVEKILNGEKTIEVRKTAPKCALPVEVYIYCTKGDLLREVNCYRVGKRGEKYPPTKTYKINNLDYCKNTIINGKVVAKFTLKEVEEICPSAIKNTELYYKNLDGTDWEKADELRGKIKSIPQKSCLTIQEIEDYVGAKEIMAWEEKKQKYTKPSGVKLYPRNPKFWHIFDLQVFDKPKELREFHKVGKTKACRNGERTCDQLYKDFCRACNYELKRPPQSWQFVEVAQ